MKKLKEMIAEQHRQLEELSTQVQRKEVTPPRIVKFMRIVARNLDVMERIALLMEVIAKECGISLDRLDIRESNKSS